MQIERVVLFDLDLVLKDFLREMMNGKFPATARSHGQVGFHALLCMVELFFRSSGMFLG